ncbi:hypothetical protein [Stenotrophomonas maltophilia]|uniref:hypothetical protein n=1 Tax=Stenotrophomonas maltophilia TaxID=40324 RepID=UPI001140FC57|nr:hypothetical protein [Stenotrophomonas maltophilia]
MTTPTTTAQVPTLHPSAAEFTHQREASCAMLGFTGGRNGSQPDVDRPTMSVVKAIVTGLEAQQIPLTGNARPARPANTHERSGAATVRTAAVEPPARFAKNAQVAPRRVLPLANPPASPASSLRPVSGAAIMRNAEDVEARKVDALITAFKHLDSNGPTCAWHTSRVPIAELADLLWRAEERLKTLVRYKLVPPATAEGWRNSLDSCHESARHRPWDSVRRLRCAATMMFGLRKPPHDVGNSGLRFLARVELGHLLARTCTALCSAHNLHDLAVVINEHSDGFICPNFVHLQP